ncbi:hypothetical protein MSPP1_000728 [Malassezia sp. CBS 17886]|nr:hypothetical protein MSPP1_000728 [Malassezia sp. CBS 17886]
MLGLWGLLRNALYPAPFRVNIEYADGPARKASEPLRELISTHCPSIMGGSAPAPTQWLPTGHLQTLWSAVGDFASIDRVRYERVAFVTPDGGTLSLDIAPPQLASADAATGDTPTVLVLHGLTGGSVRNCVSKLSAPKAAGGYGFRCIVLNARGCAGTPLTTPQLYSASNTVDVESALLFITKMYPEAPIVGIGFSLGGAILAKYMGQQGRQTPLIGAVTIGAPFDLAATSHALESGWHSWLYSKAMGSNLKKIVRRHINALALRPSLWYSIEMLTGAKVASEDSPPPPPPKETTPTPTPGTLRFMDHHVVAQVGGLPSPYGEFPFESAEAYYRYGSATNYIADVQRPFLALNADDDPIVPLCELTSLRQCVQHNANVVIAHTHCGGHLGWFAGSHATRWLHHPVNEFIAALFDEYEHHKTKRAATGLGSGGPALDKGKRGNIDSRTVELEVFPLSALPAVMGSVDEPEHLQTKGTQTAWLRTQVLEHLPLVHPADSPVLRGTGKDLPKGELLRCNLVYDSLRPEIGYIALPKDVDVGTCAQGDVTEA